METDLYAALVYMTEATLATIEYMVSLKKQNKHEINRQMNIARIGLNAIAGVSRDKSYFKAFGENFRVATVAKKFGYNVEKWRKEIEYNE